MLVAVGEWGNRHLADPDGPPLEFVHRDCGAPVHIEIRCAAGHDIAENRDVVPPARPGSPSPLPVISLMFRICSV